MIIFKLLFFFFWLQTVFGFTAYDCSEPERVKQYDLLSAGECEDTKPGLVERSMWGEVVQLKETFHITAYSCYVVVTTSQQHCGMFSHAGIQRHQNFRQVINIEPQLCRAARDTKTIILDQKTFNVTANVRNYFNTIVSGHFDEQSKKCYGNDEGLVIQNDYEAFFGEKPVQVHTTSQTMTIPTVGGPLQARVHDESLMDSEFGTFVWKTPDVDCPDSMISLYRGQVVVKTNTSSRNPILTGAMVIIDIHNSNESQVAGLEIEEQLTICGAGGYRTHIKDLVFLVHPHKEMSVARGKFEDGVGADMKRLETALAFETIRSLEKTNEVIQQIRAEICINRMKQVNTWLKDIAAGNNPYATMHIFGRGHLAIPSAAVVYISKCKSVDVVVRKEDIQNCTLEIPIIYKNGSVFVNPVTNIIQRYPTTRICSRVAPPRYLIAGEWFCGYPEIMKCEAPEKVTVEGVKIDDLSYGALHFGDSLYSKAMLSTFEQLAQAEYGRKAFLTDTAHQAIAGQREGKWGSGLSDFAVSNIVDTIGGYFIPFYNVLGKPAFLIMMVIFVCGLVKVWLSVALRAFFIAKKRGCGAWIFAGLCGTLFYLAMAPARLANRIVDGAVTEAFGPKPEENEDKKETEKHELQEREKLYPNISDSIV